MVLSSVRLCRRRLVSEVTRRVASHRIVIRNFDHWNHPFDSVRASYAAHCSHPGSPKYLGTLLVSLTSQVDGGHGIAPPTGIGSNSKQWPKAHHHNHHMACTVTGYLNRPNAASSSCPDFSRTRADSGPCLLPSSPSSPPACPPASSSPPSISFVAGSSALVTRLSYPSHATALARIGSPSSLSTMLVEASESADADAPPAASEESMLLRLLVPGRYLRLEFLSPLEPVLSPAAKGPSASLPSPPAAACFQQCPPDGDQSASSASTLAAFST